MGSQCNKRNKIRNDTLRQESGVESIITKIEMQHVKWFGQLNRVWLSRMESRNGLKKNMGKTKQNVNDKVNSSLRRDVYSMVGC